MNASTTDFLRQEIENQFGRSGTQYRYRSRTLVERALFLATAEYCYEKLGYPLDGLTPAHRGKFHESGRDADPLSGPVSVAFDCQAILVALSPTHPSARGNEMAEQTKRRQTLAQEFVTRAVGLCEVFGQK